MRQTHAENKTVFFFFFFCLELKWDIDEKIKQFLLEERSAEPVTMLWLNTCVKVTSRLINMCAPGTFYCQIPNLSKPFQYVFQSRQIWQPVAVPRVFQPQKFELQVLTLLNWFSQMSAIVLSKCEEVE